LETENKKIIWTHTAARDFEGIFNFIYEQNPVAAFEITEHIEEQVDSLARFPKLGRMIPEIKHMRYRELIVGEYRIFHQVTEKEVVILRIFHSRRLFPI
jgi:addiction module RelE/StbE family toxin